MTKTSKKLSNNNLQIKTIDNIKGNSLSNTLENLHFILLKKEQQLEIWTVTDTQKLYLKTYFIKLANSMAGTRISDNQSQIPEGIYTLEYDTLQRIVLNFPNQYDSLKAKADKRPSPTLPILISEQEGNNFITLKTTDLDDIKRLIKQTGISESTFLSVPSDSRNKVFFPPCSTCPNWHMELYAWLDLELNQYKVIKEIAIDSL